MSNNTPLSIEHNKASKDIHLSIPIPDPNANDKITLETGIIGGPSSLIPQSIPILPISDSPIELQQNLNITKEIDHLKPQTPLQPIKTSPSINLDDFYSARSIMLDDCISHSSINLNTSSNLQPNISNCFSRTQTMSIDQSSSTISQDKKLLEMYQKMKELISNEQYDQLNMLTKEIIAYEMSMRKNRHEEKMIQIKEIEETMKKQTAALILAKKTKKIEEHYLINAMSDEGYTIITKKELEKTYELIEFKDYDYYIKRTQP